MFEFAWHYTVPVAIFAYCYTRIMRIIRRQRKVGSSQNITMVTVTRDRNTGQVQQQETAGPAGATAGPKLSRTQLNVLQTMITVVLCFVACWTPGSLANVGQAITVCLLTLALYFNYSNVHSAIIISLARLLPIKSNKARSTHF